MLNKAASIALWGFGREGRASHAFVRALRPDVPIFVLGDDPSPPADLPPDCTYIGGPESEAALAEGRFALVIKSPGISIIRPVIAAARARGVCFTSGTNLWFTYRRRGRVLGFTGTKGKSTTTAFATRLIANAGYDVRLLGNAGTPALSQDGGADATVLELSSYQIADLAHAPDVAAVTNLYPEHVPWHGSLEAYYTDKLRLAFIDPAIPLVANHDNAELRARLASRGKVIWCNAEGSYCATPNGLTYKGKTVTVRGSTPDGMHNLSNLAVAAATVLAAGFLPDPLQLDLSGLVPLSHRQEVHRLANGCLAIDDSIATVPQATLAALARFADRPIHLILGGSDRGQDYGELISALAKANLAGLWLLPETGHAVLDKARAALPGKPVEACADLAAAVEGIAAHLAPGQAILLSPAAPSFAQFADFQDRGRQFVALCSARWGLEHPEREIAGNG